MGFGKFMPDILKEDEYKIRVQLNINFKDSLPDLNGLNDNYIEEESYGREYIMSTIK